MRNWYQWFSSHTYQSWLDRHREVYQGFGMGHLCPATAPPMRQWVFHPLWSIAWADQEELIYLRQPLRYRLNPDGTFALYSVGENLRDDGGDSVSESANDNRQAPSPWNGKDWVWPIIEVKTNGSQISGVALQHGRN